MEAVGLTSKLIIRASNQNIEDQVVNCSLNWTVKKLKLHLSEAYPRRPEVQDQKLIYSGQLLHDHLSLREVFGNADDRIFDHHILHLVCNSLNSPSDVPCELEPSIKHDVFRGDHLSASERVQNESSSSPPIQTFGYLRQRFMHQDHMYSTVSHSQFPITTTSNSIQVSPEFMAQQFATMQQMYAYYNAQYMQRVNISHPPIVSTTPETTTTSQSAQVIDTADNLQNHVPRRPENQNVRMNAHGGPAMDDDDDEGNRDWLDWFYLCSRGLVLIMVVYFYSSPERFAIVSGLVLLVYIYQGWLAEKLRNNRPSRSQQPRQEDERNLVEEPPNNSDETDYSNYDFSEADIEEAHEMESVMDGDEPLHVRNQLDVHRIVGPAWTFISSFFSSLLPEQPAAHVNIN